MSLPKRDKSKMKLQFFVLNDLASELYSLHFDLRYMALHLCKRQKWNKKTCISINKYILIMLKNTGKRFKRWIVRLQNRL